MTIQLTREGLREIFPKAPEPIINAYLDEHDVLAASGVNHTRQRLAYALAQVDHETKGLTMLTESVAYATLLWAVAVLPPLVIALWRADPASLNAVTTALAGALSWFAILAGLNGFVAQDSTRAKVAALDGKDAGGIIGRAIKTIVRK